MGRGVPGDALEVSREIDDPLDPGVALDHLAEGGRDGDRLIELHAQRSGDRLGDPIHLAVRVAEHPSDVADRRLRQHRAERDDLGDVVLAVLASDVGDDLVPAAVLEVDVDVGHRHAVRVQEPLERELVQDRVDRRDAERVGHDRAGCAASARRLDALLAGEPDEVRDDQEVGRIAHRDDHAELVVEPLLELRGDGPVARRQAALALLPQPRLDGVAVRDREVRDPQLAERQRDVGHLRDPTRVADRLGLVREQRRHLGRRLHVELGAVELHAVGRVEVVAGPDAEQHVVRLGLVLAHVVEVVGHDERQPDLGRQLDQLLVEPALLGQAVVLELEEEPVLAEDVAVLAGDLAGELPVVDLEGLGDLAAQARRQPDQPGAVARQVLAVDAGLVVVPVEVGVGGEPAEVLVARPVLGEQDQVEGLAVGLALLVGHRPARDVGLDAEDRLDALGLRRLVERDRAIERAVVGDRERIHAVLGGRVHQLRDPAEAVEETELGVHVEVGEVVRGDGHRESHGSPVRPATVGVGRRPARVDDAILRRHLRPASARGIAALARPRGVES